MSWIMSREERESFLAETRVGILSIALEGRGPLASPIWYGFEPGGDVQFVTDRTSRKGKLLKEEELRISLCVQDDAPPYRYACVEGPVVRAESLDTEAIERELANRYLGPEGGERYMKSVNEEREPGSTLLIQLRPERWLTADYSKEDVGL